MTIVTAALVAATAVLAWLGTRLVIRYALPLGLVQAPNDRSFHSDPVPHGGGLGLVLPFLAAVAIAWAGNLLEPVFAQCLIGAGGVLAAVGLWDDIRPMRARTRLVVQFCAVAVALALLARPNHETAVLITALGYCVGALLLVWWLNLYNFMDGIDGLATVECLCLAVSALLLLSVEDPGASGPQLLLWLLAAANAGFLYWNWPPARIFLGDVGSLFIGFALAVIALGTVVREQLPLTVWLVLGGVFWVDSTLTLLRRMLAAEPWHQAHRSHAYQRYTALLCRRYQISGLSPGQARARAHRATVLAVLFINFLWLLPLAWLVIIKPLWSALWLMLAWLPLALLVRHASEYE